MKTISTALRISWNHLKSIWLLQVIAFFVIAIIIFAVLIQVFRSPDVSPDNFADLIYNFFNDWALVLSAAVTLLLASAAFLAILDNRHARILNTRERQLKDIINWASQILKCGRDIAWLRLNELSKLGSDTELISAFNIISWDGVYIENISKRIDDTLHTMVLNNKNRIRQHVKILELIKHGNIKHVSSCGKHRDIVDDSAKSTIERAGELLCPK